MGLSRRETLIGFGVASCAVLTGRQAIAAFAVGPTIEPFPAPPACQLTPLAAQGPFYNETVIERTDIADGRQGVPLDLVLEIVEADKCVPLSEIRVDVWHADATGCYSGFQGQGDDRDISTVGETFLRGTQVTNSRGEVRFTTVYPGWYAGRTPHIHFKLFADTKRPVAGQMYLPEDLNAFVFARVPPYNNRRYQRDTYNRDDRVLLTSNSGRESIAAVAVTGRRLTASLTIGIDSQPKPKAGLQSPSPATRPSVTANSCREPVKPGFDI